VYDFNTDQGRAYMVMEFLEGQDLKTRLATQRSWPLEEILRLVREVGEGLAYAHRYKVIHRDIKPANVFITSNGQVKILDFGLARVAASNLTRTGSVLGTPNYMSPEMVRAEKVDPRSDIFSLGALFYELLTGQKPFEGRSMPQTFYRILNTEPEPISVLAPRVPPEVASVVDRALAKNPADRYQRMEEMLKDLEAVSDTLVQRSAALTHELDRVRGKLKARRATGEVTTLLSHPGECDPVLEELVARIDAFDSPSDLRPAHYLALSASVDQASADYGLLKTIVRACREVNDLVERARSLEADGQLEAALGVAEDVLRRFPGNRRASRLRGELSDLMDTLLSPQQKADRADELFRRALGLTTQEEWGECVELLTEALRLAPDHLPAAAVLERVREEIMKVVDADDDPPTRRMPAL
jgi:tetratricopeptide (TPR) repeat protein